MLVAGRLFRGLFLLLAIAIVAVPARSTAAQYAAIVMDMRDGTVLDEANADRRQAPASLTKMMTLYLAFEAIEHGPLSLDQKVRISRHAASQPPSKLYLKAGQTVTIRSLIRAAAIKSANDAAVALAEAIGGSEPEFARLMTAKARQLGMKNTTFRNASGLTAPGHLSTARDMAVLGRHLFFDFPDYYNLFSRKSERAAGKRIWTTNRLLASYRGADGIKTGYTSAAGYNLVASAHRGDKRIIAALLGGRSSRSRNNQMAALLDRGFARAPASAAHVPPAAMTAAKSDAPLPPAKPGAPSTGLAALAGMIAPEAVAATAPSGSMFAPLYSNSPLRRPGAESARLPMPAEKPAWAVEIGTFDNRVTAVARVTEITLGDLETLASAAPVIDPIRGRQGKFAYRVRFTGLSPAEAEAACASLKAGGRDCTAVAPRS